jgi:hypothetical protein
VKSFLLLAALVVANLSAQARNYQVPTSGISLDLPDDWTQVQQPQTAFAASSPQQIESVTIVQFPADAQTTLTPDYIHGIESGLSDTLKASGGSVAVDSETQSKLAGISCYILRLRLILRDGRTIYLRDYPMVTNGKLCLFSIQSMKKDDDKLMDTIAGSFRAGTK